MRRGLVYLIMLLHVGTCIAGSSAIEHAPIGVMGDHFHKSGESMLSVRYSFMSMRGNRFKGAAISNEDVKAMPNPLSVMPPKLSIVPQNMTMSMAMIGGMYAPSDSVTLMLMGMFISKDMDLNTYQSMMSRELIGSFSTSSNDISNFSLGALFKIHETPSNRWHGEITVDKSVGNISEQGVILTPMNMRKEMILPYGMQIGDKATRLIGAITNIRHIQNNWVVGGQIRAKSVVEHVDWYFGDTIELNAWVQQKMNKAISVSARVIFKHEDKISGRNSMISGPVQTANPENYGGKQLDIAVGVNILAQIFPGKEDRLGIELVFPLDQNKNNLQMDSDYGLILGYQKSF
jgi:hypothetical protein